MFRLDNKVAVVTGSAGDGIGRAIALGFARAGARVAVWDVRDTGTTCALLAETGQPGLGLSVDVTSVAQVAAALEETEARLGPVDILVNNAAVVVRKPFLDLTETDWDTVHTVNLKGYFLCAHTVTRRMVAAGRPGRIINVSSVGAVHPTPEQVHYAAAKGGVAAMTRGMALELARYGITVNDIAPGTVETDFNRHLLADPTFRELRTRPVPLGRLAQPADMVGAALLLASDAGAYITGAQLTVDGGLTI